MRLAIVLSSVALAAACATQSNEPLPPVEVDLPPLDEAGFADEYLLAMSTVDTLVEAGNVQKAIDRLTQLLGNPDLSREAWSNTLLRRAKLRFGPGNDVSGAVMDLTELVSDFDGTDAAAEGAPLLETAQAELDALLAALSSPELTPTEEFEILFRLGRHQDAADLMLARNLSPEASYISDMYDIGYLCEDETLTGPSYDLPLEDGGTVTLRFCDFGK